MGTQALMEQGYSINRNAGLYISLVRWLLSYYTGWNFINSHNMDSLIHIRSLTLKIVTEGSYRKEFKQIHFIMISEIMFWELRAWSHFWELRAWSHFWELRAALLIPGIGTDKEQRILEKWHTKEEKCNILDSLKLNVPWQNSSY